MQYEIEKLLWFETKNCFINGEWIKPSSESYLKVYDPSYGSELFEIARSNTNDVNSAVLAARNSFNDNWSKTSGVERGRLLNKVKILLQEKQEEFAIMESIDVGKPLSQSRADVNALIRYLEFYAGAADKIHGEIIPYLNGYTVYTLREPFGVTGHIIPWNYPMQIIGRSVIGSLAVGNSIVLKPSEEACLTALAFADICAQAGLPEGVLNVVPGLGNEAGKALSLHNDIDHISFTGSFMIGQEIQKNASKNVIPLTLELGGKSPQIVFDDANVDDAIPYLINAGIQNAGQTCSASSRILIQKNLYSKIEDLMIKAYNKLTVGPAIEDYNVGPLISKKQLKIVQAFIKKGNNLNKIAETKLDLDKCSYGNFIAPTLFGNVSYDHELAQEELFGPIQTLTSFESEEEAVHIANSTRYGLVASVWTNDGSRQMRLPKKIKAGQIFVNNYGAGGGVELPFGGVGHSGFGREKGLEALKGFSSIKTVAVKHG
tara:strand:+ start:488 stop:1951 length:1464 start_codon:yes stop_codon:yes gene_type:complete